MKKYRIRVEHKTSRDGKRKTVSFYPEIAFKWFWIFPEWSPVEYIIYDVAKSFSTLEGAKECIEIDLAKYNKEMVETHNKIYKVCIQESKESIELC